VLEISTLYIWFCAPQDLYIIQGQVFPRCHTTYKVLADEALVHLTADILEHVLLSLPQ
jgi:hypothetical protein